MKTKKPISFWKPVTIKPVKTKPKSLFSPKFIQPINLKKYPSRTKSEWNLIDRKPFGDRDRDRVPNMFDCKPMNRKKQGAIPGKKIKAQHHFGKLYQPFKEKAELEEPSYLNKPEGEGVVWTSTYTPNKKDVSEWGEFLRYAENLKREGAEEFIVRPIKSAKAYKMSTNKDVKELREKYGVPKLSDKYLRNVRKIVPDYKEELIDWRKFAQDYDAIQATEPAIYKYRLNPDFSTYTWDVESTAFIKPVFRKVERLVQTKEGIKKERVFPEIGEKPEVLKSLPKIPVDKKVTINNSKKFLNFKDDYKNEAKKRNIKILKDNPNLDITNYETSSEKDKKHLIELLEKLPFKLHAERAGQIRRNTRDTKKHLLSEYKYKGPKLIMDIKEHNILSHEIKEDEEILAALPRELALPSEFTAQDLLDYPDEGFEKKVEDEKNDKILKEKSDELYVTDKVIEEYNEITNINKEGITAQESIDDSYGDEE